MEDYVLALTFGARDANLIVGITRELLPFGASLIRLGTWHTEHVPHASIV